MKYYLIEYEVKHSDGSLTPVKETPGFETEEELEQYICYLRTTFSPKIKCRENI